MARKMFSRLSRMPGRLHETAYVPVRVISETRESTWYNSFGLPGRLSRRATLLTGPAVLSSASLGSVGVVDFLDKAALWHLCKV